MSPSADEISYLQRSLKHEHKMLKLYRERAARDAGLLLPLANACRRAACFEWRLNKDAVQVRRLWSEAARTLGYGWTMAATRKTFNAAPHNFTLALHLAIAASESDVFIKLAHLDPALRTPPATDAELMRGFRALTFYAQSYGLISRAIVSKDVTPMATAGRLLATAVEDNDMSWWEQQYPDATEAGWRFHQFTAECRLLLLIAQHINRLNAESNAPDNSPEEGDLAAMLLQQLEESLIQRDDFVNTASGHHPKLYVWLPGIALLRLAVSSRLDVSGLDAQRLLKPGIYDALPPELLKPA